MRREEGREPRIFCWLLLLVVGLANLHETRNQVHIRDSEFPWAEDLQSSCRVDSFALFTKFELYAFKIVSRENGVPVFAVTMESPAPSRTISMTIVAILALAQAHWALWASLCEQEQL